MNAKIYFNLYLNVFAVMFSSITYTYEARSSVPAMYVFGDSLVDVGNNNYISSSPYKSNFPHNGIDFPTGATGRFSNGKNAADLIADKLGLPSPPPYLSISKSDYKKTILTGVSFASGGSGILNGSFDTLKQCISLSKQVDYYSNVYKILVHELRSDAARHHLSKSLFTIVIGSNDLYGYFKADSSIATKITPQDYVNSMVSSMSKILKQLYALGARKFVITGAPALGCAPEQRVKSKTLACNEMLNFWARKYNYGLISALQAFRSEFNNTNYSYLDTYGAVAEFIHNPNKYGFAEIRSACCGSGKLRANIPCLPTAQYCLNRDDHIFWDLHHPAQKTSSIFIDMFYNGSPYEGMVKINTDAALFEETHRYSYSMVVRDHAGDVVEAMVTCKQRNPDPLYVEAIVIREALSWVKSKEWNSVLLETDCLAAVQVIRCSSINLSYLGRTIDECKVLLAFLKERNVTLNFVKRSANRVAHHITRNLSSLAECIWSRGDVFPDFSYVLAEELKF